MDLIRIARRYLSTQDNSFVGVMFFLDLLYLMSHMDPITGVIPVLGWAYDLAAVLEHPPQLWQRTARRRCT